MVEPIPTKNPGVYVARVVSDVFIKAGSEFHRLSEAPRNNLSRSEVQPREVQKGNQGEPEEKGGNQRAPGKERGVRAVITPGSPGDHDESKDRELCYCMIEVINMSASMVELGKNVKLGDREPLMLCKGKASGNEVCANQKNEDVSDFLDLDECESGRPNYVNRVSKMDDESSAPPEINWST